jgi:putative LysE/RhtB family amino acid efflux pump
MLEILFAIGIGLVLGAATGIPLGVVNVAVVEAATRISPRQATAIGVGGALSDGIHAALAFAGIAPMLSRYPDVRRAMLGVSAAVVIGYAALVWRRHAPQRTAEAPPTARSLWRAIGLGASLTLPNPAALAAWIGVAGLVPHQRLTVGVTAAAAVAVGSAGWFAVLARLAGRRALGGSTARWFARGCSVLLVILVVVAVIREVLHSAG